MVSTNRFELPVIEVAPVVAKVKKPRKAPAKKAVPVVVPAAAPVEVAPVSQFKTRLTIALGVAIPLLSLATSKVAGTLAQHGHYPLAAFGALIGVAVLAVSLAHLAWAISDVTGSGKRSSWALAIALDCSLVLCELVHVTASDVGLVGVCWAMLAIVAAFSMVLNCHAFLNHKS